MKRGEKAALWAAAGLIVGVGALTLYLESEMELGKQSSLMASVAPGEARQAMPAAPAPGTIPRGLNPDDLPEAGGHGATLLTIYCVQCHDLPNPAMHTADEWQAVLDRMENHIRGRRGGMLSRVAMPSKRDWDDLRDYLARYGQRPFDPSGYDDLDTPAAQAFQQACSQCHAPPDPALHTAREWPRVVVRMKYNMADAGKPVPDAETLDLIVDFLRRHSREG